MADIKSLEELLHRKPEAQPMIYAYSDVQYPNCLKVGYTSVDVDKRVAQQYPTKRPDGKVPYKINLRESAMLPDGSSFMDHQVHRILRNKGIECVGGEWYKCTVDDVKSAIIAVKTGTDNTEKRTADFPMRPEQAEAVTKTINYYNSIEKGRGVPKFLWNCKMRFGKTFATYQLAKKLKFKRILVLTFKPAVKVSWKDDLLSHIDFEGWQFISRPNTNVEPSIDEQYRKADKDKPIVCFGSFQDFLGINKKTGSIKAHNTWVHEINWDLVVFDEYHFGAWKSSAKALFDNDEDSFDNDVSNYNRGDAYDETYLPITTNHYLYLSGTPFRALHSGEFIEEQIYNWTYSDEQRAKENWVGDNNPYASLPKMHMLTYKIPDSIQRIAKQGEFDEFDLNLFFKAEGNDENAKFIYEDYVQKWIDLIRGSYLETTVDDLKLGAKKPPMPFSDATLLNLLNHTLWYLPNVASCYAMYNLLRKNNFFNDYKINVCAGIKAGIGAKALEPVQKSMKDPLNTKTITLSCGKLMTGVTVKPWTGIFMLSNMSSPETYFQAAFRVQSPWEITKEYGTKEIIKKDCFVFDFALDRALKQISDYSCKLNVEESNPEKKVGEFIHFLPVLAYDGSSMKQVDAGDILDIAMAGTSATLLAKRWESALLVNVDNDTLTRLLANEDAMKALMAIEGFRSLNEDITTIINKSEKVKKAKKEKDNLTKKEKKELSEEEKEFKSKRKEIQEKLMKFATRIPVFMYLTDFREYSLKDVITQLEPQLFKKVTGLSVKDFELLVSLNVFNESLMNDAVYKFKRYEDASLEYTGLTKHTEDNVGLFNTVITRDDYDTMSGQLANSMVVDETIDVPESESANMSTPNNVKKTSTNKQQPIIKAKEVKPITPSTTRPASRINRFAKAKIDVDLSAIKVGITVKHKAFGEGTVIEISNDIILVNFNGLKKQFQYPSAFEEGFLII